MNKLIQLNYEKKQIYFSFMCVCVCVCTLIQSCTEDTEIQETNPILKSDSSNIYYNDYELGETSSEQMRKAILELTNLSKEAFNDSNVREEVSQLIQNTFYKDHVVSLEDLLNPSTSLVYNYASVNNKGAFKEFFDSYISDNENKTINLVHVKNSRLVGTGQSLETFYDYAHLTFYLPYDENDELNPISMDSNPTLVPAVVDADQAIGYEFNDEGYSEIIVDDNYSANNFTLIIQPSYDSCSSMGFSIATIAAASENLPADCNNIYSGAGSTGSSSSWSGSTTTTPNQYTGNCNDLKPAGTYIRQVYVGRVKGTRQYDRKISFTGNGGGSEIMFCRADSRDNIEIDSLNNITLNQWNMRTEMYWSRKQIRRENVRNAGIKWDENWACADTHEQLFVIYEEDNEGNITIDDELSFSDGENDYELTANLNIQNRTKDEVINKRIRERVEFFATNLLDNGCNCWDGDGSFSDRCWGIQECGSPYPYTMYHRWVFVSNNTGL